jgi:hypothetical protein
VRFEIGKLFDSIKKDDLYLKDGIYRRSKNSKMFPKVEYLVWDHLHQDVEGYDCRGRHLGSIDPHTNKMYKNAVNGRRLFL